MARVVVDVPDALEAGFARAVPTLLWALECATGATPAVTRQAARHKYDPVAVLLASRAEERETDVVVVALRELDELVVGGLPRSAWGSLSWWAPSQPQARAWSNAGWVARPLLREGMVVFRRARVVEAHAAALSVAP